MRTAAEYLESLRNRSLRLFVDGEAVTSPVDQPKVRPAINAVAATYALAHPDESRELATTASELVGARVNRFTGLFREPEDLVKKLELWRVLGRLTGPPALRWPRRHQRALHRHPRGRRRRSRPLRSLAVERPARFAER